MLPLIAQHNQVFTFRFWLDDRIHEGLHYGGDLFCHVQTFPIGQRVRVYHLACKLEHQGNPTLVLLAPEQCSLWISLRGSMVEKLLLRHIPLELPALQPALPLPSAPHVLETLVAPPTPAPTQPAPEGNGRSSPSYPQGASQSEGAGVFP